MNRLFRRIVDGLAAVSLLLCIGTLVLWYRSEGGTEDFTLGKGGWDFDLSTVPDQLVFVFLDYNQPAYVAFSNGSHQPFSRTEITHSYLAGLSQYPQRADLSNYLIALHEHPWF